MSSADSSYSASSVRSFGPNVFVVEAGSFPFLVAGFAATCMGFVRSVLGDGIYYYTVGCGSDCWVGSVAITLWDYTSGGASVISVFSVCCFIVM
jgi:hypothetical protein